MIIPLLHDFLDTDFFELTELITDLIGSLGEEAAIQHFRNWGATKLVL